MLLSLTIITYLAIGSKMPIIALILSFGYYFLKWFKKHHTLKIKLGLLGSLLLIVIWGFVMLPKTNMYQNILIHLDYLEVDEVKDIFSYKFIDRFVFSDRLSFLKNTEKKYAASSIEEKLLGIGYIDKESKKEDKVIEMDFFDIYYRAGLLGFILVLIPLFIRTKKLKKKNDLEKFSMIIALLISFLAGHVLTSISSNKKKEG